MRASVYTVPMQGSVFTPAISEPVLTWTIDGELEVEDRDDNGPWIRSSITKGSFFLTSAGAPYYCRWKTLSAEPHRYMLVVIGLPILQSALEEVHGSLAERARLRDISGFKDEALSSLLEQVLEEVSRRHASALRVQGLARLIAVHLARHYSEVDAKRVDSPSLPGYRLKQITDWMSAHLTEEFQLDQLAGQAGVSRFHFNRLFKRATGLSPSRYQINLRMNLARRLLRETKRTVVEIALEVGYTNPSHFAQLFRRDTGLTPSDYRLQR
jgi:AraC family transcriptional regulator